MAINFNEKLSEHFTIGEFFSPSNYTNVKNKSTGKDYTAAEAEAVLGGKVVVDAKLVKLLEAMRSELREKYGGAKIVINPHGGYRPTVLNKAVGGATGSQHRYGRAADFSVVFPNGSKMPAAELAVFTERFMSKNGYKGGVGMYDADDTFIHVDVRGSNVHWYDSYSSAGCPGQGGIPCVYRAGTKGAGVVLIQQKLKELKYYSGVTDGKYGAKTAAAIKNFQKDAGLTQDGIYGKGTNAKLGALPW